MENGFLVNAARPSKPRRGEDFSYVKQEKTLCAAEPCTAKGIYGFGAVYLVPVGAVGKS